jgi:dethiobiotin synthetase
LAGARIDLDKIAIPEIPRSKILIVEGAGGALVPINQRQLMTDLMRHLRLPVLLVTRTTLGTINHTLLSLAALRAARLKIAGVVMCGSPNIENRKAIEHYGKVRVIGELPLLAKLNRNTLSGAFRKHFDRTAFGA